MDEPQMKIEQAWLDMQKAIYKRDLKAIFRLAFYLKHLIEKYQTIKA